MLKPFLYAVAGVYAAVKGERNMRIHLVAAVAAVSLGAWLGLSSCEWAAVDLASPEIHPFAKRAKDCAAGAVLLAAIGSAAVGCIVFVPKLLSLATLH